MRLNIREAIDLYIEALEEDQLPVPVESWEQYQQIIEMLGLDLDDAAIADLREARQDRIAEQRDAYVVLIATP